MDHLKKKSQCIKYTFYFWLLSKFSIILQNFWGLLPIVKCRVMILGSKPKLNGLLAQWAQYNEFVESESKNWAQVN